MGELQPLVKSLLKEDNFAVAEINNQILATKLPHEKNEVQYCQWMA